MNELETRKYQLSQLLLLDEFDRVCTANKLNYCLIGGTLLGAVRHKGFIPWDIDIDVAMPREDYDRFSIIFDNLFNQNDFFYQSYLTEKKYYSSHARLCLKDTEVHYSEHGAYDHLDYYKGIYIDIFPLDYAPLSSKKQKQQKNNLVRIRRIRRMKKCAIYDKGFLCYKVIIKKMLKFILLPVSLKWLNSKETSIMKRYNDKGKGNLIVSMASHYSYEKQLFDINVYFPTQRIVFEKKSYSAPNKYLDYLTQLYGNYMSLPSKIEQARLMGLIESVDFGKYDEMLTKKALEN